MLVFRKRIPVYIRISENRLFARRLDKNVEVEQTAEFPFSSERLLLANYDNLYKELNSALAELNKGLSNKYKFVFQLVAENLIEVAQTEKMCLNDLGLRCGANWVYIIEHNNKLSDIVLQRLLDE